MTREDFLSYIAAFNANDFDGFSRFYADDVDFNLGDRKRLIGPKAIVDFYREVKAHISEELEILDLLVGDGGFAMHNRTTFRTFADWPDFELWPTKKGDVRQIESVILYRVRDGKFVSIKSARFKQLA